MRSSKALTLIELMATLAIAGVLTAAALSVAANLARVEAAEQRRYEGPSLAGPLRAALGEDILRAKRYRVSEAGAVQLETFCSLDGETMAREHLLSTVTYEVRQLGRRRWLLRGQRRGGAAGENARTDELLCPGVQSITMDAEGDSGGTATAGQWKAMPPAVTVTVTFEADSRPPMCFRFRNE